MGNGGGGLGALGAEDPEAASPDPKFFPVPTRPVFTPPGGNTPEPMPTPPAPTPAPSATQGSFSPVAPDPDSIQIQITPPGGEPQPLSVPDAKKPIDQVTRRVGPLEQTTYKTESSWLFHPSPATVRR